MDTILTLAIGVTIRLILPFGLILFVGTIVEHRKQVSS